MLRRYNSQHPTSVESTRGYLINTCLISAGYVRNLDCASYEALSAGWDSPSHQSYQTSPDTGSNRAGGNNTWPVKRKQHRLVFFALKPAPANIVHAELNLQSTSDSRTRRDFLHEQKIDLYGCCAREMANVIQYEVEYTFP